MNFAYTKENPLWTLLWSGHYRFKYYCIYKKEKKKEMEEWYLDMVVVTAEVQCMVVAVPEPKAWDIP